MSSNLKPRSAFWPVFAAMLLLLSGVLFTESREAEREGSIIPETTKNGPMTPAQGYAASALSAGLGVALLVRWIQLIRRRDGDEAVK